MKGYLVMVITAYVTEINFAESSLLQKIVPSGKYTFNWRSKRCYI